MPVSTVAALQLGSLPDGKAATLEQILGYEDEIKRSVKIFGDMTLPLALPSLVEQQQSHRDTGAMFGKGAAQYGDFSAGRD